MADVCISAAQRRLHMTTEAIALFVMAPFLVWLATRRTLSNTERSAAAVAAVGTVLVDGYLLMKYSGHRP